jgi:hypothetical protein
MNKGRRQELKMLKYKRRIGRMRLQGLPANALYAYRSHGKPCSCFVCRGLKYDRAKERERARKLAEPISELAITAKGVVRQTPYIPAIEGDEEQEEAMMRIWFENNFED